MPETYHPEATANPFSTRFWAAGAVPFHFADRDADTRNDVECRRLAGLVANRGLGGPVTQIVGPHGSGKSTLLTALSRLFEERGYSVRRALLNDVRRQTPPDFRPKASDSKTVFLLDGYEQLSTLSRLRLRRRHWNRTAGLLWTTHRPAPFIPVLYRTVPRFAVFAMLVRRLTENTAFDCDESTLQSVFERAQGNFRDAFFELYDRFDSRDS